MSSSTCFSGLVEFLHGEQGVKDVHVRPGRPATAVEISSWEKGAGCVLPEDVKTFYLTHSGLQLTWSYLHNGATLQLGRIHVASLSELRPLVPATQSRNTLSLSDLEPEPGTECEWQPPLSSDAGCPTVVLDYCPTCGHTCLVAQSTTDRDTIDGGCSVWLLDLGLSWHKLSSSFSDYLRLATVHLGLKQWPYALTPNTLGPRYECWFHIFIPHRLEVDTAHHNSTNTATTTSTTPVLQGSAVVGGGSSSEPIVEIDVSKILQTKPPRDKSGARLKSASSKQPSSSSSTRRSSKNT